MSTLQEKWKWFSRLSMVVKVWHSAQVALPFLVAAYAAFSAYSESLSRSQVVAFTALALGGALLAVNQLRMLLGVPIEVKSRESYEYGLRYTGIDVAFDFRNADSGLQILVGLANSSRGPIQYQVERLDVILGHTTLPNKQFENSKAVIHLMGSRVYRDAVFPHALIAPMIGTKQPGTVEMSVLYGPVDREPKRRLSFKLGIWIDIQPDRCTIADILQREEDTIYYK